MKEPEYQKYEIGVKGYSKSVESFSTRHFFDGNYHRDEKYGPSCEWYDGTKHWRKHGYLHREGGLALEGPTDTRLLNSIQALRDTRLREGLNYFLNGIHIGIVYEELI